MLKGRFEAKAVVLNESETALNIEPQPDVADVDQKTGRVEIDAPAKKEEYDPRTLYERLQTERQKKEEEFIAKTKLGNLIKKLDPDEVSFISAQQEEAERRRKEQDESVKSALDDYRKAVIVAHQAEDELPPPVVPVASVIAAGGGPKAMSAGLTRKRSGIEGIVAKKKRKADEDVGGGGYGDSNVTHSVVDSLLDRHMPVKDDAPSAPAVATAVASASSGPKKTLVVEYDSD